MKPYLLLPVFCLLLGCSPSTTSESISLESSQTSSESVSSESEKQPKINVIINNPATLNAEALNNTPSVNEKFNVTDLSLPGYFDVATHQHMYDFEFSDELKEENEYIVSKEMKSLFFVNDKYFKSPEDYKNYDNVIEIARKANKKIVFPNNLFGGLHFYLDNPKIGGLDAIKIENNVISTTYTEPKFEEFFDNYHKYLHSNLDVSYLNQETYNNNYFSFENFKNDWIDENIIAGNLSFSTYKEFPNKDHLHLVRNPDLLNLECVQSFAKVGFIPKYENGFKLVDHLKNENVMNDILDHNPDIIPAKDEDITETRLKNSEVRQVYQGFKNSNLLSDAAKNNAQYKFIILKEADTYLYQPKLPEGETIGSLLQKYIDRINKNHYL